MLGSLQFFNALVVRLNQKPEGYCSVLDNLVWLMAPAAFAGIAKRFDALRRYL
jgi:hypothetical protein